MVYCKAPDRGFENSEGEVSGYDRSREDDCSRRGSMRFCYACGPFSRGRLWRFGQFLHGAFLRWLRETAPDVSAWLHDGNKRRLFTCSSLQFGYPQQRMLNAERENTHLPLDPEKTYFIRITLLLGKLFPLLHEALMRYYPNPHQVTPHFFQLGKQRFTLEEIVLTPTHPSGQCGFTSLTTLVEQAQQMNNTAFEQLKFEFAT